MNKDLLRVDNLSVSFQGIEVVSHISFSIRRGEVLALVGESGCGKSASCLALTGLLPSPPASAAADSLRFTPETGESCDLLKISGKKMRKIRGGRIAYIFQEPAASLNPVMRVGSQIAEVLALHRPEIDDERAEVISLLRQVGIPAPEERIDSYPHEMSGGMQQRVMIAMALAGNPELLIADEPTTALDVTVQAQILELLDRLRRERQMAVILISHNLGVVARLADRVAVMYAGMIVESGTAEEILCFPAHPYTRALLAAVPRLGGERSALHTIPGFVPAPEDFPKGCRFCGRCQSASARGGAFAAHCAAMRPELREISPGHLVSCFEVEEDSKR